MSDAELRDVKPGAGHTVAAEFPVHFVKGSHFRVVHADGAWFGSSPQGNFHVTFYSERTPIPRQITVALDQRGTGTEIEAKRDTKQGLVREMEVDVVLSMQAAIFLRDVLSLNIENAQRGGASPPTA